VNWSITDILHKHDEMVNKHELLYTNQREHPKQEKQSKANPRKKNKK
jgi:hypothetical protein